MWIQEEVKRGIQIEGMREGGKGSKRRGGVVGRGKGAKREGERGRKEKGIEEMGKE